MLTEFDLNKYVTLTKDIPELNLPKGTLGIVTRVFDDEECLDNEPYIGVIQTVTEPDVAISADEIEFCAVDGKYYV